MVCCDATPPLSTVTTRAFIVFSDRHLPGRTLIVSLAGISPHGLNVEPASIGTAVQGVMLAERFTNTR